MYNYAQDLDTLKYKAEYLLGNLVFAYVEEGKISLKYKEYVYALAAAIDVLNTLTPSNTDIETIISFILENYEIDNVGIGPYNSYNQVHLHPHEGSGVLPHTHTMDQVIGLIAALANKIDYDVIVQTVIDDPDRIPSSQAVYNFVQSFVSSSDANLKEDVEAGVTVGGITIADVLLEGTTFTEFVQKLLTKQAVPPTTTLTIGSTTILEAGTIATNLLSTSFSQNDAGDRTTYALARKKDDGAFSNVDTDWSTYTENLSLEEAVYSYQSTVNYLAGNPAFSNPIAAGSITSNIVTLEGARSYFASTSTNPASIPASSANVRAGTKVGTKLSNGGSYNVTVPINTRLVWFAYDATLGDPTSIKHVETNFEYLDEFTITTLNVEGANSYLSKSYKLVYWVMDGAWPSTATFRITT